MEKRINLNIHLFQNFTKQMDILESLHHLEQYPNDDKSLIFLEQYPRAKEFIRSHKRKFFEDIEDCIGLTLECIEEPNYKDVCYIVSAHLNERRLMSMMVFPHKSKHFQFHMGITKHLSTLLEGYDAKKCFYFSSSICRKIIWIKICSNSTTQTYERSFKKRT